MGRWIGGERTTGRHGNHIHGLAEADIGDIIRCIMAAIVGQIDGERQPLIRITGKDKDQFCAGDINVYIFRESRDGGTARGGAVTGKREGLVTLRRTKRVELNG